MLWLKTECVLSNDKRKGNWKKKLFSMSFTWKWVRFFLFIFFMTGRGAAEWKGVLWHKFWHDSVPLTFLQLAYFLSLIIKLHGTQSVQINCIKSVAGLWKDKECHMMFGGTEFAKLKSRLDLTRRYEYVKFDVL